MYQVQGDMLRILPSVHYPPCPWISLSSLPEVDPGSMEYIPISLCAVQYKPEYRQRVVHQLESWTAVCCILQGWVQVLVYRQQAHICVHTG